MDNQPNFRRMVYDSIDKERMRQDNKWGGPEHDDKHDFGDWCQFIKERLVAKPVEPHFVDGTTFEVDLKSYESEVEMVGTAEEIKRLKQIAALAIAAMESILRQELTNIIDMS